MQPSFSEVPSCYAAAMDADVKAAIYGLVARHSGLRPEMITAESRLLHDLGINGDDAEYLLMEFLQNSMSV
jgi:hypothetical protein